MPFSAGPRACIGRRFTETESVAVLTMLILKYRIGILEEPQYKHETKEDRWNRVLKSKSGVTMTCVFQYTDTDRDSPTMRRPIRVPLVFTKRG